MSRLIHFFVVSLMSIFLMGTNALSISNRATKLTSRTPFSVPKNVFHPHIAFHDTFRPQSTHSTSRLTQLQAFPDQAILPVFYEALLYNGIFSCALFASKQKSLTTEGLWHSTMLGIGLWTFLGWQGWATCVSYLILGSAVTKLRMKEKEALGIAEKRGGARGPENVWGSAFTAMMCAISTYLFPQWATIFKVGYVASLATKISDTFGSEIGKGFGKTTYLITTFKRVPRGTEGAVSLEGTLAGIAVSFVFAAIGSFFGLIQGGILGASSIACVIAAFVATTIESYIGATFQDSIPWLTNELVNLINTLIGAAVAMLIYSFLTVI